MTGDVVVVVAGVGWLLWAGWWMWRYHFVPMRNRRKVIGTEDDVLLRKVAENLMMLHDIFGLQVRLRTSPTKDGMTVAIVCEKCERVNRLLRGFRGARCGNCKKPFVVKDMRTSAEKEVRLN